MVKNKHDDERHDDLICSGFVSGGTIQEGWEPMDLYLQDLPLDLQV